MTQLPRCIHSALLNHLSQVVPSTLTGRYPEQPSAGLDVRHPNHLPGSTLRWPLTKPSATLESQHPQLHREVPSHPSHSEMGPPIVLMAVVPASVSPKKNAGGNRKNSSLPCTAKWGADTCIFICTCHKFLGILMIFPQVNHQIYCDYIIWASASSQMSLYEKVYMLTIECVCIFILYTVYLYICISIYLNIYIYIILYLYPWSHVSARAFVKLTSRAVFQASTAKDRNLHTN